MNRYPVARVQSALEAMGFHPVEVPQHHFIVLLRLDPEMMEHPVVLDGSADILEDDLLRALRQNYVDIARFWRVCNSL